MNQKIRELFKKYRDIIPYAIFGVLTTLVNMIVYWAAAHPLGLSVMVSTVLAWILAVMFAYITNRKWVFHSQAVTFKEIAAEAISFFTCRLATGVVDWACMFIFVDLLHFNDVIMKAVANILVIILNYIASKLIIFRKKPVS